MKGIINEVLFLRFIACLGILLMHSITLAQQHTNIGVTALQITDSLRMILMFGTPMFIFISEFVIARSYPKDTPKDFLNKRVKYILVPFLFMSVLYAILEPRDNIFTVENVIVKAFSNIFLGTFHGYFIVIIFQFYLLHNLFYKHIVKKFKPKVLIIGSILFNLCYLAVFDFFDDIVAFPKSDLLWPAVLKLAFPGWVSYFVIGYYCGANYEAFKEFLSKNKRVIYLSVVTSIILLLYSVNSGLLQVVHSRRFDVMLYTISITLTLFAILARSSKVPPLVMLVSKYSFGIYLLHPMILYLLGQAEINMSFITYLITSFVIGLTLPILIASYLSKTKVGPCLIGTVSNIYSKAKLKEESAFERTA